jgi:hypothetical protein
MLFLAFTDEAPCSLHSDKPISASILRYEKTNKKELKGKGKISNAFPPYSASHV